MKALRAARSLWLILLFAACIPAQTPTVLDTTPAPGAVITKNTYQNDLFSMVYPEGWRVITSAASAPLAVTFVSPDNCALVIISTAALDHVPVSQTCGAGLYFIVDQHKIMLGTLTIAASAPDAEWTVVRAEMEQIAASIKAAS